MVFDKALFLGFEETRFRGNSVSRKRVSDGFCPVVLLVIGSISLGDLFPLRDLFLCE